MYLSKVTLAPSRNMAHILLNLKDNDVYSAHQLLWKLFTKANERCFLFREEISPEGLPLFFVLSTDKPSVMPDTFQVQTKAFEPQLTQGQPLGFKLRVNPTVCITNNERKQKRHDVLMHAKKQTMLQGLATKDIKQVMEQAAFKWINNEKRLNEWGVCFDDSLNIESYTQHQSRKKGNHTIQFSSVDFQGQLTINDPVRFLTHYKKGFGRSKSFGCGLMLIRNV